MERFLPEKGGGGGRGGGGVGGDGGGGGGGGVLARIRAKHAARTAGTNEPTTSSASGVRVDTTPAAATKRMAEGMPALLASPPASDERITPRPIVRL